MVQTRSQSHSASSRTDGQSEPNEGSPLKSPEPKVDFSTVDSSEIRTRTALLLILIIFLASLSALAFVYYSFPHLDPDEAVHVKFPKDIEDAKKLGLVLSRYKDRYFAQVLGGVFVTYLFLQTFAIPGSIFLSIVSGFLFPFPIALVLICFCSATGASFCYLLSFLVGRKLVKRYLPERAASWSKKVEEHKHNMLSYIIFLRITPFLPNWFINIVSPVIGVDLRPFWLGTFLGVAPPSFVAIQAGTTLQQLTSTTDAVTFSSVILLVVFAILSILPILFKEREKISAFCRRFHECACGHKSDANSETSQSSYSCASGQNHQRSSQDFPYSSSCQTLVSSLNSCDDDVNHESCDGQSCDRCQIEGQVRLNQNYENEASGSSG